MATLTGTGSAPRVRTGWLPEALGLLAVLALMAAAMLVPAVRDWNVHVNFFPPLHAAWQPRTGPGSLPAVLLGALACWRAVDLASSLAWRRLLVVAYVAGLAWMVALAAVDGGSGLGLILEHRHEYLGPAREVGSIPGLLSGYVDRIPFSAPDNWPPHLAGHPPGAVLFYVLLVRVGLGGWLAAGLVTTAVAASTAVAVLVVVRTLGSEEAARRAAPFLVVGPAAIWQCVSADGMFAAFAAWGMAALAVAAVRRSVGWGVVAGLLLGWCVMMSYGLPLLGILAVTVLWLGASWRPLVPAALAAAAVVLGFAALGFSWWEGMDALHDRYWDGIASRRPASYWLWGNLAALAFCAGPVLGPALARAGVSARSAFADARDRVPLLLAGAGVAMVAAADLSRMSKAEVERIWLPFVPWLLVATALLPPRWRRAGVVLQVVAALLVQHLLEPDW
jgi:hypothetical protein